MKNHHDNEMKRGPVKESNGLSNVIKKMGLELRLPNPDLTSPRWVVLVRLVEIRKIGLSQISLIPVQIELGKALTGAESVLVQCFKQFKSVA